MLSMHASVVTSVLMMMMMMMMTIGLKCVFSDRLVTALCSVSDCLVTA